MSDFAYRNRDAYGVIRGFVYQVDQTILRLLNLRDNEKLILECGEDIDKIAADIRNVDAKKRTLEQIKYRTKSITLRSAECLEALVNAVEHIENNPSIDISIQFTTNATSALEARSPFNDRRHGIVAWEQCRIEKSNEIDSELILNGLRQILFSCEKPEKVANPRWLRFRKILEFENQVLLREFISKFSWLTSQPDAVSIRENICDRLITLGLAFTKAQAISKHCRLFVYVITVLSRPGVKELSPSDLAAATSQQNDRLEQHVLNLLASLNERITALELGVAIIDEQRTHDIERLDNRQRQIEQTLQNEIGKIEGYRSIQATAQQVVIAPTFAPGEPPVLRTKRTKTVEHLATLLKTVTWLELNGESGIGKSELARLVAETNGEIGAWIDCRELDSRDAAYRINAAIFSRVKNPALVDEKSICDAFASEFCAKVIVIDDIPDRIAGQELAKMLTRLVLSCRRNHCVVITTALRPPPQDMLSRLPDGSYRIEATPPFVWEDLRELMELYAATDFWKHENTLKAMCGASGGHATLLISAIRYLKGKNWKIPSDEIYRILSGDLPDEARRETLNRLLRLISDSNTRELLYRTNLAIGSFTRSVVVQLANVPHEIDRPSERLEDLIDVCIQRVAQGRLRVSPLFRTLKSADVSPSTRTKCHILLAESITKQKALADTEVRSAISHFIEGQEPNRAAILLLQVLRGLIERQQAERAGMVADIWADLPISESIDLSLRILIRANQALLYFLLDQPFDYVVNDLENLIRQAEDADAWAVASGLITAHITLLETDSKRANRLLLHAMKAFEVTRNSLPDQKSTKIPDPSELLWTGVSHISSVEDLLDWIGTVDTLPAHNRQAMLRSKVGLDGAWILADAVWLALEKTPKTDRDWDSVLVALQKLGEAANRWGSSLIKACAIRAQIVVLAESKHDLNAAIGLAERALESSTLTGEFAYPIRECLGRQFLYNKRGELARKWLSQSLLDAGTAWPEKRAQTLFELATVQDQDEATASLNMASRIADECHASPLLIARLQCGLALQAWNTSDSVSAVLAFERCVKAITSYRDESQRSWRAIVAVCGHVAGYLFSMASFGKPPETSSDGGPFAIPELRFLSIINMDLADWLRESHSSMLIGLLALTANVVGVVEVAERWTPKAIDVFRKENNLLGMSALGITHTTNLVVANKFAEAIDFAFESAQASRALRVLCDAGDDIQKPTQNALATIGHMPSAIWDGVYRDTLLCGIFPIVLQLAGARIEEPARAKIGAESAISALEALKIRSAGSSYFDTPIRLLKDGFVQPTAGTSLVKLGNESDSSQTYLKAMAYICASVQDDATPEIAAQLHLLVFAESKQFMPPHWPAYRLLVLPFLEKYWRKIISEQSFRFTPPTLYRNLFDEASKQTVDRKAQAILSIAFEGLRTQIPERYKVWLRDRWV